MTECRNLEEIRSEIDRIDTEIVALIAKRSQFVNQVVKFKKKADPNVPSRNEEILQRVTALSKKHGLDPTISDRIYRTMIAEFVRMQKELMNQADDTLSTACEK